MSTSENKYPSSRYAWYTVIILTVAYIFSFVDRWILGLLVEPIKADLGVSDSEMGLLLGIWFALFYAIAGLPLGYLADRKRRTWIVAVGVTVWSAATAASGFAKNFWHMALARMGVGAGEATLSPCAMSMISDSFPPERRGRPIAFYTAALSVGAAIASLVSAAILAWTSSESMVNLPIVGEVAPWRATFFIVGLPGLLLAVVFFFMREPPRIDKDAKTTAGFADMLHSLGGMLSYVGTNWKVYASFVIFVCLMTLCAYSQGFFAAMFSRTWGWPGQTYALVNGLVLLAVGPLTVNLAGWMSDKFYAKGRRDAPFLIVVLGAFIFVPTQILAPLMPTPALAFVLIGINTIGIAMTSATGVTALLQITPSRIRAQTIAFYYLIISLAGAAGPRVVGQLSDKVFGNENLNYAMAATPLIFGLLVLPWAGYAVRTYNAELARHSGQA